MARSPRRFRATTIRAGALALVFASFLALGQTLPARADGDREAAANAAEQAQATVNALQSQLEGIDASLAQVYIDLQNLNGQIPAAQAAYDSAAAEYDSKSREHATILGRLSAAQGEQSRIGRFAGRCEYSGRRLTARDRRAGAPQVPRGERGSRSPLL